MSPVSVPRKPPVRTAHDVSCASRVSSRLRTVPGSRERTAGWARRREWKIEGIGVGQKGPGGEGGVGPRVGAAGVRRCGQGAAELEIGRRLSWPFPGAECNGTVTSVDLRVRRRPSGAKDGWLGEAGPGLGVHPDPRRGRGTQGARIRSLGRAGSSGCWGLGCRFGGCGGAWFGPRVVWSPEVPWSGVVAVDGSLGCSSRTETIRRRRNGPMGP